MNATLDLTLYGGIDVGNGYVKAVIENAATGRRDVIDLPSSVAVMTRPNQLPVADEDAASVLRDPDPELLESAVSFYNQLDASFKSALVPDSYRRVFGTRSLTADGAFEEFDTLGRASKAKQPLSKVLVLGVFAAKALRDHVQQHHALPHGELQVSARAALALPINEFMRHREVYAAELCTEAGHLVVIENFETPVVVRLRFVDVQVLAEGASAQYAITAKGEPLMTAMLSDVRRRAAHDPAFGALVASSVDLDEITAGDVLAATNTIGVDVGEGTVNLVSFVNGQFNTDASTTFAKGYGSVLTAAIKAMEDQGIESGFYSRKELAAFLQRTPSALKRAFYTRVKQFVDEEARFFASEVAEKLGAVLRTVGATTEVAFVYGGGSGPIKDALYPALVKKVAEMNSISAFPVFYLDASYSRHLNREGLFIAVQAVAARAGAAAPSRGGTGPQVSAPASGARASASASTSNASRRTRRTTTTSGTAVTPASTATDKCAPSRGETESVA